MMYLQLHLHERKLLPISNMSVAYCHVNRGDNIHRDSLAQWQFRLYKLRSLLATLHCYTKLLNLTACSHARCLWLIACMGTTHSQQLGTLSNVTRLMPLESK